jgi:hypothetical protein
MSISEYQISKILFIKGVFIQDCIPFENIFEQQIIDKLNIEDNIVNYIPLPSIFRNISSWVKKTNNKCWYCDLNFESVPLFIPKVIDQTNIKDEYNISTMGCFCSFSCCIKFNNIHNTNICDNIDVRDMILFLYKIFNGKKVSEILPAPEKYIMKHYGGDITPIEYKKKINQLSE